MAITQQRTVDTTVEIFDSFYNITQSIPSNQYGIVLSFFKSVCDTEEIAENFTAFLFRVANASGVDALEILDNIKGINDKLQIDQKFAYYLNSFKSRTSLYGVSVVPKPVVPVARNVVL